MTGPRRRRIFLFTMAAVFVITCSDARPGGICGKGDCENGFGKMRYRNGDAYIGRFQDGQPVKGKMMFANGDVYRGEFRNGYRHGEGFTRFKNGDLYQGQWRNDRRHGFGVYLWAGKGKPHKYVGMWTEGRRTGHGTLYLFLGGTYNGDFVDGKFEGKGSLLMSDINGGARYVGDFKNGKFHGRGIYIYKNGKKYIGEFKNGMKDGAGLTIGPDGNPL